MVILAIYFYSEVIKKKPQLGLLSYFINILSTTYGCGGNSSGFSNDTLAELQKLYHFQLYKLYDARL
jgi:hypothetical protein